MTRTRTHRLAASLVCGGTALGLALGLTAAPAAACGGLVAPNGAVRLTRTTTLAAYHDGVEHYVTSFQFAGGGAGVQGQGEGEGEGAIADSGPPAGGEFGSIVPLPGVPTNVERGGDWTLQRLEREVAPPVAEARSATLALAAGDSAQVLLQTRIDALDLTVLKGGGAAVGDWAREHGFLLTPDAPEVLDFYAKRSPIFLAARFDAAAAKERGLRAGDGTPIHLTIPLDNPWVPLRILALGRGELEPVNADVFLLTDSKPALLPQPEENGLKLVRSEQASSRLLSDLRSDKGMEWVPSDMWLSFVRINTAAQSLNHDLAVDTSGSRPSLVRAGLAATEPPPATPAPAPAPGSSGWLIALCVVAGAVVLSTATVLIVRRAGSSS